MNLAERLAAVRDQIEKSAGVSGRKAEDITLVAVSKTIGPGPINEAVALGARDLGENRVQEWMEKRELIAGNPRWHIIGQLQKNKVKYILGKVALVHSLSSLSVAEEMQRLCARDGLSVDCLIQMNIARETQKSGVLAEEMDAFVEAMAQYPLVRVRGLMTMAPLLDNPQEARPCFAGLRTWFDRLSKINTDNISMEYLSMGMSGDYTVAIEEGANIVRVGSAIFGHR